MIGFKDFNGSADIGASGNDSAYWSQSYQQVKSLYQEVTGKKVDTTKLWNRFSSLRGNLKKVNANMININIKNGMINAKVVEVNNGK